MFVVQTVGTHAITTDIWTSSGQDSFISYTAHFITVNWERKVAVIRCMPYNTDHTGDNISNVLHDISNDWGLGDISAVVRDNAANMVCATSGNTTDRVEDQDDQQDVEMEEQEEIECYCGVNCTCHVLHLIVKHSLEKQVCTNISFYHYIRA